MRQAAKKKFIRNKAISYTFIRQRGSGRRKCREEKTGTRRFKRFCLTFIEPKRKRIAGAKLG